mmetsp:Transcript_7343/g.7532  ORF Transcript_7343/g.7532 Transcript_7343/m.7532 type:complete len:126 (+) Transcript_7343:86-463(+)
MYEAGNKYLKPDANTICSVIDAWASSTEQGAVRRVVQLLRKLMDMYELGNKEMRPSTLIAFTFVIKALSKSAEKCVAMQAQKILYSRNFYTGSARIRRVILLFLLPGRKVVKSVQGAWQNPCSKK